MTTYPEWRVSGRKSDVLDCQWLQQLMSYGLLAGAFRPKDEICALRAVSRQREMLLAYQARHVQHMQEALVQMNRHRVLWSLLYHRESNQQGHVIVSAGVLDRTEPSKVVTTV
jgi:hypothetical protein